MTRDEFGGYCCKKWSKLETEEDDEDICNLLGLDIEAKARELIRSDLTKTSDNSPSDTATQTSNFTT